MKKRIKWIFIAVLIGFTLSLNAQTRQIRDLDAAWKFKLGDFPGAENPAFNDQDWRVLDVPHDWRIEFPFEENIPFGAHIGYLPVGIGWYRKAIDLSKKDMSNVIWIEFDGIYMNSDVWINGQHLGHYPFGYNKIRYDLNKHVRQGKNTISVKVDNSLQPNSRWYNGTGIYRHVRLVLTQPLHIGENGIYVTTPEVEAGFSTVAIQTLIQNTDSKNREGSILSVITNKDGVEVEKSETPFACKVNSTEKISQNIRVSNPELWSPDSPVLYTLKSSIQEKGKPVDQVNTPFGIRKIEFLADKGFLLNGKQLKMKGVNLHHDGGCVGVAVPEAVWAYRFKILKEMGCNAIRTSHNPVAPEFLDLCDQMGFLVMNESFDEWKEVKGMKRGQLTYGYHINFDEYAVNDLTQMIRRDRNHPSVVIWSVGNEVPDQASPNGHLILKKLTDVCHTEDPTRPVTQGCSRMWFEGGPATTPEFLEGLDLVGYNYADRWGIRREIYATGDKIKYPHWKMIGTENISIHGVRGRYSLGNDPNKVTPDYNSGMIDGEQLWKFVSTRDYFMGDFMWTGFDYIGEATWPDITEDFGVIDRCGFPKDAFHFYKSQWTEASMIYLFPHWNWAGREGQFIPVLCYTNCDVVELFLNGRSIGEKRMDFPRMGMVKGYNKYPKEPVNPTTGDLHLSWDVPYEAGVLKAVGKKNGKVVMTQEIKTTGAPAALRMTADKNVITTGNRDAVNLKIEIVDKDGDVVPTAGNLVTFTVEGQGKLIGVDNGNPQDHNSFKLNTRNAFNGLCLAVIQATEKPGSIKVVASSDQLGSVSAVIEAK
jgi:beta-galactosidase